jgi:O-methyltransferase
MTPQYYLQKYPIISDQITRDELLVLLRELAAVLGRGVAGDIVELGCYEGTSALFEARIMQAMAPHKQLWLYDSFQGLPVKASQDSSPVGTQFKQGELNANKSNLIAHFKKAGLPMPHIKKAWFNDLAPADLPDNICFAFLDGDFYESIKDSLKLVWPKLVMGGVLVVDDYQNEALPGAATAVDEFAKKHGINISVEQSLAVLT